MNAKKFLMLSFLTLGACAVGEDYQKPKLDVSDSWQSLADVSLPAPAKKLAINVMMPDYLLSSCWWKHFNDPILNALLEEARMANNDLKVAQAHIAEAQGLSRSVDASLFPQIGASGSLAHNGAALGGVADTVGQAGVNASWDIDLFGGDRRSIEAARAEVQATEADRDKVLLTVMLNVATYYIQLRSLQEQRQLTVRNLKMQQDTLKITLAQRKEGAISDLEVARAKAQVSGTASRLPQIDTAIVTALNRIGVLTGEAPRSLGKVLNKTEPIPSMPSAIAVSTPLDVIENRPDVKASERRLAEATALSGAAFSQLFPKITLQGFFGGEWSHAYGPAAPFNASAGVLMPLLEWGRIRGQIDAADARQTEAFFTYKQTILLVLEEIENALTALVNEQKRQDLLMTTMHEQEKATEVAREQYKVGATTQLDLLTAENSQLAAENDLTLSRAALATDLVQLYIALGKAWPSDEMIVSEKTAISDMPEANENSEPVSKLYLGSDAASADAALSPIRVPPLGYTGPLPIPEAAWVAMQSQKE